MKRVFSSAFIAAILFLMLTACGGGGDTITGTWIVSEYDNGENTISTNEISELYGEVAAEFNKFSMIFTESGNVTLIRPDYTGGTNEAKLAYTVQDGLVEIYDPDDKTDYELYDYDGDKIRVEITNGLTAIFTKK